MEGPEISRGRARHRALSRGFPVKPRRRVLCQPGRRSRSRHRRPQILCAGRCRAPQARHAAHRQEHLCARKRLGDLADWSAYYDVTNDPKVLAIAERAAKWVIDNRALPDGGFRHGEKDRGGPFLGDTLAMGQAFLDLYAATGNRDWLNAAAKAGDFVAATFRDEAGGFLTSKTSEGKDRRVRQAGQTDGRPDPGRPLHEPARSLLRQRRLSRAGLACDALSRRRIGRDDPSAAGRVARRRRTRASSRPI